MEINRRDFITKVSAIAALSVLPSSFVAAMGNEKVEKAKPKYPTLKCDVVVVGAGPGGVPAAIAAARQGAKVILLEEDNMPGGAPVDMYVPFICGGPRVGVFQEMIQVLNAKHTIGGRTCETFGKTGSDGKNHWWMPGSYAEVIYQLLEKEENITLMCAAPVVGVKLKTSGNRNQVTGVRIMRNGDYQDIDAADGKVQPCTWMLISERIKRNAILPIDKLKGSSAVEDNLNRWVKADDKEDMIRRDAGIYLHWGRTVYCKDTREPLLLAQAQQEALERLQENLEIWHEAGYAVHLAPKLGVREVRRIKGEYVLTANDLIAGTMHDDVIAHAHYSFDVWGMKIPEEMKHIGPYGIPYRSILPTKTEGLLTAGRIISATRIAHSSLRVQPICSNIGMAAGTAAAMSALNQTGLRSIDIKQLQDRLASMGLFDGLKKK